KEAVDALLHHSDIEAISFVGSTPIAEYIYTTATAQGKRCQALGGAKNHAIVMPDADLDNVVTSLLGAAFGSSGERCMALSVAVAVGDDIADKMVEALQPAIQQTKLGAYSDKENEFSPVITQAHKTKILERIKCAESRGTKSIIYGSNAAPTGLEKGFFVGPTL